MSTNHPAQSCTRIQRDAFEQIAIGQQPPMARRTIQALLKKGLVVNAGVAVLGRDRFGQISVPIYEVPLPIHVQWCRWCSENYAAAGVIGGAA